jgi:hypothetical protein
VSKKLQLKTMVQQYKATGDTMSKKISEITNNNGYTEEYKRQLIQSEKQKLIALGQDTKEKAMQILKDGMNSISKASRPNVQDHNYQLGLSNALKLLELGANNLSGNDIKTLLEPFAGDQIATAAFKGILLKSEKTYETADLIPVDHRGNSLKQLQGIENTINQYISPSVEWDGLTGAGIALYGIDSSIDKLDDDLNYVYVAPEETAETLRKE